MSNATASAYSYTNAKGTTYYLHTKEVVLRGDRKQRIYYFAKQVTEETALDAVPENYDVVENKKTGLPMLKKQK